MNYYCQSNFEKLIDFIKGKPDVRELKRALAVKLALKEEPYYKIQAILNVSIGFISKWKKVFLSQGTKGLLLKHKGGISYLTARQKQKVIDWLKQKDYWSLKELYSYLWSNYQIAFKCQKSYYQLFKAAGISWKKSQKKNPKKDPEKVKEKKEEIIEQLQDWQKEIKNGSLSVFIIDECHLLWGDVCGYVWGKTNTRVEVPMTNQRFKQTYFGALDYQTKKFLIKPYPKANSENTVDFLKYLQQQKPGQRIAVIWEGASYHKYEKMRDYLLEVNSELSQENWQVTCILLAPNAPEQNPVEDIWLVAKNSVRENYYICKYFKEVKGLFVQAIEGKVFDFSKVYQYG